MRLGNGLPTTPPSACSGRRIGPDGATRDFSPAAGELKHEVGWLGLRRPPLRRTLRTLLREAERHGYEPGEHALGGAYLHRGEAVREIARRGWYDLPEFGASGLSEDHLMALITRAAGFRIADFGGPGDPMALRWRGLPAAPEQLVASGALLTHSVRFFADIEEPAIRAYFAAARPRLTVGHSHHRFTMATCDSMTDRSWSAT